jgi:hypothetical protein
MAGSDDFIEWARMLNNVENRAIDYRLDFMFIYTLEMFLG